ncbi:helix-turn-helix domain-containing protein [Streptomyces sp. LUP30]|uniref:helix-turn-helix domain-containing protein n=1 Tax=Streptomyces sp. LUP30 TaxID=1890285 RepID=UPI0009A04809|nr:helix-turn-helix domain-containing protein [Streptomyces sp. LUP30]
MVASPHTDKFAACLRMLKERSGRGYDRLGKEAGVSGSSLHRYCSGLGVPTDYRVVHSFAKVCGASAEELRELHRLWALADTDRDAPTGTAKESLAADREAGAETVARWEADARREAGPAATTAAAEGAEPGSRHGAPPVAPDTGADDVVPLEVELGTTGRPGRSRMPEKLSPRFAVLAAMVAVLLVAGFVWLPGSRSADGSPAADDGLLYSPACKSVSMGQHDECVREVQTLLVAAKGRLAVDGDFGPETLRRLTAFQVLARLPASNVVDEDTKKALYARRVSMSTWSPARVAERIRQVFTEDPASAVAVARCASFLDPLWVLPNTNGSRNWGVFQISDGRLRELGGTPLRAFDPEWNIKAAHRLWSAQHDFHDWPSCEAALKDTPKA